MSIVRSCSSLVYALAGVLVCAAACAPRSVSPPPAPATELDAATTSRIPTTGLALVVYKSERRLEVISDGRLLYAFPIVLGRKGDGPKRYEGDARTPEGSYRVTQVRAHPRWRYFIAIDYPNADDVAAYLAAIASDEVPVIDGELVGMGSGLGIHGTDRPDEQAVGIDWTKGCIALDNQDVALLAELVSPGTPVVILP